MPHSKKELSNEFGCSTHGVNCPDLPGHYNRETARGPGRTSKRGAKKRGKLLKQARRRIRRKNNQHEED